MYGYNKGLFTTNTLAAKLWKEKEKYNRMFGYTYMVANVTLDGKPIKLFFTRSG